jgi:arginine-tRNA-protein transferase
LRVVIDVPRVDDERLDLYARWHAMREAHKGWEPSPHDAQSYGLHFAFPHPSAREVAFYEGEKLVGVGISDETPRAWSLVFFYYDPELLDRSLGVVNVLVQIEHAQRRGIPHAYLGYRVMGCASLAYKARYRPHELLIGRPLESEIPEWR